MENKELHIGELILDDKNLNYHTEYGMSLLEKSVRKFGMGRSILIDKNNKVIAGNGITETAADVGIERVRVVETDGNEIIAVKRKDIDLNSDEGREMALADNATNAANLRWNFKGIKESGLNYADWGVDVNKAIEQFHKEIKEDIIRQEYPITILQNEEEYNQFRKISDLLGLSNMDTFVEIMNFYIKEKKI